MSLHPFAESTFATALANLDEAIETLRRAQRTPHWVGATSMVTRALHSVEVARTRLTDAIRVEEMAVTVGEEAE